MPTAESSSTRRGSFRPGRRSDTEDVFTHPLLDGGQLVPARSDRADPPAKVFPLPHDGAGFCRRLASRRRVCDDGAVDEDVIPILRVEDAATAVAWYERLGFAEQWEHRFEPELPAFVEVVRGGVRLFLSEHRGDARPDTLVYLRVRDVDAVAREFGVPVNDAPWAREIELRDPDGNRLRIGTPVV